MRHAKLELTLGACALVVLMQGLAHACAYPVRDAAFTQWPRGYATLFLLHSGKKDDPKTKAWRELLEKAGQTTLAESNVGYHEIDTSIPEFSPKDFGLQEVPKDLPAVVAILQEPSIELLRLSGTPSEAELQALIDSPQRKALREHLVTKLGVALFFPGKDAEKNTAARKLLKETAANFKQQTALEIAVLEIDREDPAKQEAYFISQVVLKETAEPVVAVVFGRGKVVHDKLVGKEITEDHLWGLFSVPGGPCLCTVGPSMIGYDLIMKWPEELNKKIVLVGKGEGEGEGDPSQKPPMPGGETGAQDPTAKGGEAKPSSKPEMMVISPSTPATPTAPTAAVAPIAAGQDIQTEKSPDLPSTSRNLLALVLGLAVFLLVAAAILSASKKRRDAA